MSVSRGATIVTLTSLTSGSVSSPLSQDGRPARRVFALLGDSNAVGFSPGAENASGWRAAFQRRLAEAGIWFRFVGVRGHTASNGTGASWGVFPTVDDFHDSPRYVIQDWRNDGESGMTISESVTISSVTTGTPGTFTSNGHGYALGSQVVITSTGALPTVTGLSPVTVNGVQYLVGFVTSVTTNTFQISQFDNGTALAVTGVGSGTITAAKGLTELLPGLFGTWDEVPTDVLIMGGTNDISQLVNASTPNVEAVMEAREAAYEALIDQLLPNARKYRLGVMQFTPGITNQAAKSAAVTTFNSYLATNVPLRGPKWCFVNAGANITAAQMMSDGTHPTSFGYEIHAEAVADAVIAACGTGAARDRYPYTFKLRAPQACVYLNTTNASIRYVAQSSLNPGSDSFFYRIWYFPTSLSAGTNAIVQQENPYSNGSMLSATNGNLLVYWRNAGAAIPSTSYTAVLKKFRWHHLFVFCDFARQQCALWCNGRLVMRTPTTALAVTSSTGWYNGGSGINSALGLYQGFLTGHGPSMSIEDAAMMVQQDYYHGVDPPGTTGKYMISEGSGTSIAGIGTAGALTAGTLTSGSWIASGRYLRPVDQGYARPRWDIHPTVQTAAYTGSLGELVRADPGGGAFSIAAPSAVGQAGNRWAIKNVTTSSNAITINATVDGTVNPTMTGSFQYAEMTSDDTSWLLT